MVNELFMANTYIIIDEDSKDAVIIDPGSSYESIIKIIVDEGLNPLSILATHGHIDHVIGVAPIKREYNIPFYMHREDAELLSPPFYSFLTQYMDIRDLNVPQPDNYLEEGELEIGGLKLDILHTPGHTPGGICILTEYRLFSGDTIFRLSIGRTDFGGNIDDLINSIHNKIFKLPSYTIIYPGHGEETTVGYEMERNPYMGINGLYPYRKP